MRSAHRVPGLVALSLVLLLAGCLAGTGEPDTDGELDPARGTGPEMPAGQDAGQDANDTSGDADAASGEGNGTSGNGSGPPPTNATPTSRVDDVSMENAERELVNASTVRFVWEDTLPPLVSPGEEAAAVVPPRAEAGLELPEGVPFTVHAELAWEGDPPAVLVLDAPGSEHLCRERGAGIATCSVSSLSQDHDPRWTVAVNHGYNALEDVPPAAQTWVDPVPFTVTVAVRAEDPDAVPAVPTLVPEPGDGKVDPGWPAIDEATLRPGVFEHRGTCTANFVFATPDNATLYVGTAAHCVDGEPLGQTFELAGEVPARLAYCSHGARESLLHCPAKDPEHEGYLPDFALLEIPDGYREEVHPATRVWGGPTGVAGPPLKTGTKAFTYGNSHVRWNASDTNALDSRAGIVAESDDEMTFAHFGVPSVHGDSGSPVLASDGAAIGTLVWLTARAGLNGVSNLAHALDHLEEATGRTVELKTWPLFDVPEPEPIPSSPRDAARADR